MKNQLDFMARLTMAIVRKRRNKDEFAQLGAAMAMTIHSAMLGHYSTDDAARQVHFRDFEHFLGKLDELTRNGGSN